jgi:hypothetical protein
MITLKCIKPIKDSSVNRNRLLNEIFEVTQERVKEMQDVLKNDFQKYFEVKKIKKQVNTKPKTVKRKKGE